MLFTFSTASSFSTSTFIFCCVSREIPSPINKLRFTAKHDRHDDQQQSHTNRCDAIKDRHIEIVPDHHEDEYNQETKHRSTIFEQHQEIRRIFAPNNGLPPRKRSPGLVE